eukprot:4853343-Alexandrium_andersonii.AAC.1
MVWKAQGGKQKGRAGQASERCCKERTSKHSSCTGRSRWASQPPEERGDQSAFQLRRGPSPRRPQQA